MASAWIGDEIGEWFIWLGDFGCTLLLGLIPSASALAVTDGWPAIADWPPSCARPASWGGRPLLKLFGDLKLH